jgi:hypothetical protein
MAGSCEHVNERLLKMLGNSWVAEKMVASQDGLSCMELETKTQNVHYVT